MAQDSKLELVWRVRPGGGGKTERRYLDFVVDGRSLRDLLDTGDFIGCLGWLSPRADEEFVQILLRKKPSPLATGRAMLYVCPECGDIGCGALTVKVEKTPDHFVWSEFGFENGYIRSPEESKYVKIGPFCFNKTEYWQALQSRPER